MEIYDIENIKKLSGNILNEDRTLLLKVNPENTVTDYLGLIDEDNPENSYVKPEALLDLDVLKNLSGNNQEDVSDVNLSGIDSPTNVNGYSDTTSQIQNTLDRYLQFVADTGNMTSDAAVTLNQDGSLDILILDDPELMDISGDVEVDEEAPVQDGDNDSRGYQYDADVYNMFGDEDQDMKYVPARYSDNPLKDPVTERKTLFDYLKEVDERNN